MTEAEGTRQPAAYRRPEHPPSLSDIADKEAFAAMVQSSIIDVRASAEKWRTGMAALVSLVTAGLLLKGPESTKGLSTCWRVAVSVLLIGGLALAITGLWRALTAAAGTPTAYDYDYLS